MDLPSRGLLASGGTDDELWAHGLSIEEVDEVWLGPAKYFDQGERLVEDEDGWLRTQPHRLKMIGPDRTGRLLTIILELPDTEGYSEVVTGWPSSRGERARYDHPGGRSR